MSSALKLAFLAVVIGAGYAGYEYHRFYTEERVRMEDESLAQEGSFQTKQGELKRLQHFAQNIETIKQELRDLNFQLESALEYMPRSYNLSGLLRKLTLLAQNSGLDLYSFRPAVVEDRKEGAFYSTVPIQVNVRGTYTQTLVFFDQISRLKRILSAEEIVMNLENAPTDGRIGAAVLNTVAKVRTYRFSE